MSHIKHSDVESGKGKSSPGKRLRIPTHNPPKSKADKSDVQLSAVGTRTGEGPVGGKVDERRVGVGEKRGGVGVKVKSEELSHSRKAKKEDTSKAKASKSSTLSDDSSSRHDQFEAMLSGGMEDLPVLPKSVVRIFLSSTFTDTSVERNKLTKEVYPMLREYCSSEGLDFQVVDMRWGITNDSQNDHSVERLCLDEIAQCQQHSLGPNFVCILGDKYGFQPIPTELPVELYMMIERESKRLNNPHSHLLQQWYRCDSNAIPPVYKLQPIRTHYPHFGDPNNPDCASRDALSWRQTYADLRSLFRSSADSLHREGRIDADTRHTFFWSVTEQEVRAGILNASNPHHHTLCFQRSIHGLHDNISQRGAARYINTDPAYDQPQVDENSLKNLKKLVTEKIPKKIGKTNCVKFKVIWREGGLNPQEHEEHVKYVNDFCGAFVEKVTGLIDQAVERKQEYIKQSEYYSTPDELIHHLKFCQTKCESFCGQTEILKTISGYLLDKTQRKPFVIHAESGVGKTSVIAMTMKKLKLWFKNGKFVGVVRFLGTSAESVTLYEVLFSVCGQLADIFGVIMQPVNYQNLKSLVQSFPRLLRQVSAAAKMPIVILLDSIDQLTSRGKVFEMKWLPLLLPPNVKIVISTLTTQHNILTNLKSLQPDDTYYAQVPTLPDTTVKQIITSQLKSKHRKLTDPQLSLIINKFHGSPSPLYLKLLIDKSLTWNSYDSPSETDLRDTIQSAIGHLFETLENKYGVFLIQAALGYITVSLNGLSEIEIEDVLSCDDEVLNEVYVYHDPPVSGIVRIPSLLWARIYYELKPYLAERLSFGKSTLFWYHRQFIEAAKERYAHRVIGEMLHTKLLQIYLQKEGIKRDVNLKHRDLFCRDADRQITHQPLTVKNHRKLACVMYHLNNSGSIVDPNEVKEKVLCNFRFLFTKIASSSVRYLLEDIQSYIENKDSDQEIEIVHTFLESIQVNIRKKIEFAVQILARITDNSKHPHIQNLLEQAKECISKSEQPLLVPAGPCFVGSNKKKSNCVSSFTGCGKMLSLGRKLCYVEQDAETGANSYMVYDCKTGEVHRLDAVDCVFAIVEHEKGMIYFLTTSGYTVYDTNSQETTSYKYTTDIDETGDFPKISDLLAGSQVNVTSISDSRKFVAFSTLNSVMLINLDGNECTLSQVLDLEDGFTVVSLDISSDAKSLCVFGRLNNQHKLIRKDTNGDKVCSLDFTSSVESGKVLSLNSGKVILLGKTKTASEVSIFNSELQSQANCTVKGVFACFDGDKIGFISDGEVTIFDITTEEVKIITLQHEIVKSLVIVGDQHLAIIAMESGTIAFYDTVSGKFLQQLENLKSPVEECRVSHWFFAARMKNNEVKIWEMNDIHSMLNSDIQNVGTKSLFAETKILAVCASDTKNELYTSTSGKHIQTWSLDTYKQIRQFESNHENDSIATGPENLIIARSSKDETLEIFHAKTGKITLDFKVPDGVLSFTLSHDKTSLYLITHIDVRLYLHEINLTKLTMFRSLGIQKGLNYNDIDTCLSANGRYLVLKVLITDDDKKGVNAALKKGGFLSQPHPYRFCAVDLTHDSGTLLHCYRQLTKVPSLGITICGYHDNMMMFTARRSVVFWDITTGKCDQKMSPSARLAMMYRPDWTGGNNCSGVTDCLVQSPNRELCTLGSEDGYMIVYDSKTGLPRDGAAPDTKHHGVVTYIAISPNNQWIISSCSHHDLKLWDSSSGVELFNMKLPDEIAGVEWTGDKVVVVLGRLCRRVVVFDLFTGSN